MRTHREPAAEYQFADQHDVAELKQTPIRRSYSPSRTYRWCVLAFNHVSGVDVTKPVWWYPGQHKAHLSGRCRFGQYRYIIGRAPL